MSAHSPEHGIRFQITIPGRFRKTRSVRKATKKMQSRARADPLFRAGSLSILIHNVDYFLGLGLGHRRYSTLKVLKQQEGPGKPSMVHAWSIFCLF